jgi:hypothetical protein
MASFISLPFISAFDDKGVKAAEAQLSKLGSGIKSFSRNVVSAFGGISATMASVNFVKGAANAARDFQTAMSGVNSVYGSYTDQVKGFIMSSEKIGLSHAEAARNVTFLGSVFKKTGIPMDDVIGKTETLVTLAADLASTFGYSVQEAMTGLAAMFRGEYDPIEKFGIAMKQNQVNAELMARKQNKLTGSLKMAAETLARYDLVMAASTDSQGAFARQSGNLFNQQLILGAAFTNLQQKLGEELTPSLTLFISTLIPLVDKSLPSFVGLFDAIAEAITVIIPSLGRLATQIGEIIQVLSQSAGAVFKSSIFGFIVDNLGAIVASIATFKIFTGVIRTITAAVALYTAQVALATGATTGFAAVMAATPWGLIAAAVAVLVGSLVILTTAINENKEKINLQTGAFVDLKKEMETDPWKQATSGAFLYSYALEGVISKQRIIAASNASGVMENYKYAVDTGTLRKITGTGTGGDGSGDDGSGKVKTFFSQLAEDVKKEVARLKLQNLGASAGLIDAVLGSGTWEAASAKLIAGGAATVAAIQKQFNSTKAGLDEIQKAADEATKALDEYNDAMNAVTESIADFGAKVGSLLAAISPMSGSTRTLGAFEQAVVSAFDALSSSLADAVDNKLLFQESADDLAAYAKSTQATLAGIASQRDAIAARIADANDLIASTRSAVVGFANITSLLESQSQTIVETTTSVVDGIRLTLTRSLDVQGLVGDLTGNFQKVLDKTKKFATDLKELRRLGLDKNLFKQIVDAGLESGGATAAAIIAGGGETVAELNSLFSELNDVGAGIAEETAQVMFGAGVDVTNGLIAGLLSQDNALRQAAQVLADSFTATFNSRMADFMNSDAYLLAGLEQPDTSGLDSAGAGGAMGARGGQAFMMASVGKAKVYEVHINAGMITDKAELGPLLVDSLTRYERTNGSVWQRAAL